MTSSRDAWWWFTVWVLLPLVVAVGGGIVVLKAAGYGDVRVDGLFVLGSSTLLVVDLGRREDRHNLMGMAAGVVAHPPIGAMMGRARLLWAPVVFVLVAVLSLFFLPIDEESPAATVGFFDAVPLGFAGVFLFTSPRFRAQRRGPLPGDVRGLAAVRWRWPVTCSLAVAIFVALAVLEGSMRAVRGEIALGALQALVGPGVLWQFLGGGSAPPGKRRSAKPPA